MKRPPFSATLAPDDAKIVGGFSGGPGIAPTELANDVFKGELPGPWLCCYMLRRFGWPNSGSDDFKALCTWTITTPISGFYIGVTPYLGGGNLHFSVRYDEKIEAELRRDPGRESFFARRTAAVLKWWANVGSELYVLGTGKTVGDRDELVHAYATREDKVTGLWRRKPAHKHRPNEFPKANPAAIWWLGEFIKKAHPEVKLPKTRKREQDSRTTRFQLRLHAAFKTALRDLLRPTNVRDISFSAFGDIERSPDAIARYSKQKHAQFFAGAGYTPDAWAEHQKTQLAEMKRQASPTRPKPKASLRVIGPANDRTIQAFVGKKHAGYAGYTIRKGIAKVCNILVHPAFQRRGIGAQLYRELEKEARNAGALKFRAEITSTEGAALFRHCFKKPAEPGQTMTLALVMPKD